MLLWCTSDVCDSYGRKVVGGWSYLLRRILEEQLLGPTGLSTAGVPVEVDGEVHILFASLSGVLADGDGLQKGFDWRGASSFKICLKHNNVLKKVSIDGDSRLHQTATIQSCLDATLRMSFLTSSTCLPDCSTLLKTALPSTRRSR